MPARLPSRHNDTDLATWHRDGAVLLEDFLQPAEVAAAAADMDHLYGDRAPQDGAARNDKADDAIGVFSREQFQHFDDMPFDCSPALNLLGLHPALIQLARDLLGTPDVHLYQSHSWAKFTGGADYDQTFHCDYKNHTLTVPSDDPGLRTVNCMLYLTDVSDDLGAIHYVPNPASDPITGSDRAPFPDDAVQAQLAAVERSGAASAGSVFAYGIDVFHRGTNLTAPGGRRYTLTASYKAAGNDMIGWSAWPFHFLKRWDLVINNATPEQLACLGIPRPGHQFWTATTLRRAQQRWPDWDMTPWRDALR